MFAHQVIEDLKGKCPDFSGKDKLILAICSAQKFHMGDGFSLLDMPRHLMDGNVFIGRLAENIRLPYKLCWFDFITHTIATGPDGDFKVNKIAVIAEEENEESFVIVPFYYIDLFNIWVISEINFRIKINVGVQRSSYFRPIEEVKIKSLSDDWDPALSFLNFALMLLSCNNIGTEVVSPSIELNKKRLSNHKQPLFTYKILCIKPSTKHEKSIPQYLWQNRIHLCRGHFKSYTMEHPLFGKLTGRYWWQAQARGNKELGIIVKDYEIREKKITDA